MRAFLSYSREDAAIVNLLKYIFEQDPNIQCFIDQQLPPGSPFPSYLQKEIREADIFIVLLTKASQKSLWVQQEIGFAQGCGKKILPLAVEEDVQPIAMIRDIQTMHLGNWTYFSTTIDALLKELLSIAKNPEASLQPSELGRVIVGREERTKFVIEQLERLLKDKNRKLVIYNQAVFSSFAISDTPEYRDGEPGDCSDEYMSLLLEEKQLLQRIVVQPRTTFKLLLCPAPFGYRKHSIRYSTLLDWMYAHQDSPNINYCCGNYVSPNRLVVLDEFCIEARFHPFAGYEYNVAIYNHQKLREAQEEVEFVYSQTSKTSDTKAKAIQQIKLRSIVNDLFSLLEY